MASWQLNVARRLQQPQSYGTFHFQCSSFQALDLPRLQTAHCLVHDLTKVEPERKSGLLVRKLWAWKIIFGLANRFISFMVYRCFTSVCYVLLLSLFCLPTAYFDNLCFNLIEVLKNGSPTFGMIFVFFINWGIFFNKKNHVYE